MHLIFTFIMNSIIKIVQLKIIISIVGKLNFFALYRQNNFYNSKYNKANSVY